MKLGYSFYLKAKPEDWEPQGGNKGTTPVMLITNHIHV